MFFFLNSLGLFPKDPCCLSPSSPHSPSLTSLSFGFFNLEPPPHHRRSTTAAVQPTKPVKGTLESNPRPPTPHLLGRKQPLNRKTTIIAILDRSLVGHQNATEACEIFWDREEGVNRSILALESPHLVVGADHNHHLKLANRRRHCSSPPRLFFSNDELQGLLGFEEEEETITTQEESHKMVAGVGRNGRSKLCRRRRCNRRRTPPSATEPPPDHHQIEEL